MTKGALEQVVTHRKAAKTQTDLPWWTAVRTLPARLGREARGGARQSIYHLARRGGGQGAPPLAWPPWGWGAELTLGHPGFGNV